MRKIKGLETLEKLEWPVFPGVFWVSIEIMASEPDLTGKTEAESDPEIDIEQGLENEMLSDPEGNSETIVEGVPEIEVAPESEMPILPELSAETEAGPETMPETQTETEMDAEPSGETMAEPPSEMTPDLAPEPVTESPAEVGDALSQVAEAFTRLIDALPAGALIGLVAVFAILAGIIIGARMNRRPAAEPQAQPVEPKITRRALPAPESPVFVKYQEFLEQKGVSAKEFDTQLRAFTERYKEMRQNLRDLMPGDKGLDGAVEEIRDSLDSGDFDHALGLLSEIGKRENADGVEKHNAAQKHLMAAAISKIIAGDLQMARMAYPEAADFYREAVEALPDFQEDLHGEYLNKYGTASYQAGDHETAIAAFERALQILERKLGRNHPDVATALNNLALLHYSRGNYDAAEPLYQRSLAIDEHTLGIDHPGVATDLNNLALLYKKQGNLEAAEPLLKRAMEIKEKQFDPGHPSLVTGLKNYASLLRALGREEEAEVFERKATVLPPKRTARPAD